MTSQPRPPVQPRPDHVLDGPSSYPVPPSNHVYKDGVGGTGRATTKQPTPSPSQNEGTTMTTTTGLPIDTDRIPT